MFIILTRVVFMVSVHVQTPHTLNMCSILYQLHLNKAIKSVHTIGLP